jgi:hypothetical protein
MAWPLNGRILDVVTSGVPLGGQGEPDRRDRLLVSGPGAILVVGAMLATLPLANNLLAGQFSDVPKALLGAAIFDGLLARFLVARQQPGSPPVRLLLRGPDLRPFPAADLRRLAAAISQRPAPVAKQIQKVVQDLYEMADDTESPKGIVVDWSHRTHRNDHDGPAG